MPQILQYEDQQISAYYSNRIISGRHDFSLAQHLKIQLIGKKGIDSEKIW